MMYANDYKLGWIRRYHLEEIMRVIENGTDIAGVIATVDPFIWMHGCQCCWGKVEWYINAVTAAGFQSTRVSPGDASGSGSGTGTERERERERNENGRGTGTGAKWERERKPRSNGQRRTDGPDRNGRAGQGRTALDRDGQRRTDVSDRNGQRQTDVSDRNGQRQTDVSDRNGQCQTDVSDRDGQRQTDVSDRDGRRWTSVPETEEMKERE
jgi:hypothetical protein